MDHKHFQSAKRPFSVIFNSKPANQVISYKHEGQVSAKILLEQKADICKIRLTLVNTRSRTTIQKCQWNQSTKRISLYEKYLCRLYENIYTVSKTSLQSGVPEDR